MEVASLAYAALVDQEMEVWMETTSLELRWSIVTRN